jgi:hypothetical protein
MRETRKQQYITQATLAVRPGRGRGVDANEHLAGLRARRLDLLELEDVLAAVGRADDRLHEYLAVTSVACALPAHGCRTAGDGVRDSRPMRLRRDNDRRSRSVRC